jgi:hypothetical protein
MLGNETKEFYSTVEFISWADRQGLTDAFLFCGSAYQTVTLAKRSNFPNLRGAL